MPMHNLGKTRPNIETMTVGEWYFYFDERPCVAIKTKEGTIDRIGLEKVLSSQQLNRDLSLRTAIVDKTTLSEEQQKNLERLVDVAINLSKKPSCYGTQFLAFGISVVQEQTHVLAREFEVALEERDAYNRTQKPPHLTELQWKKQCDDFLTSGKQVLTAVEQIPKHFHQEDNNPHKPVTSQLKNLFNGPMALDRKDLDGSKRLVINDVLTRMTQELEFYPENPKEIQAHVDNLKTIHTLSKEVLGHGSPKMKLVAASCIVMASVMIGVLLAVPTAGASLAIPGITIAALAGILPYFSSAMMGVMGVVCAVLSRETGIAKATNDFKQAFKEMNQNTIRGITDAYDTEEQSQSFYTKLSGGTF